MPFAFGQPTASAFTFEIAIPKATTSISPLFGNIASPAPPEKLSKTPPVIESQTSKSCESEACDTFECSEPTSQLALLSLLPLSQAEPTAKSLTVIDPDGDLELVVGATKQRFKVSRKCVSMAGPALRALLTGGFREATESVVYLPADDARATEVILNILHSKFAEVPRTFSDKTIRRNLCYLIDKYDLVSLAFPWQEQWMQPNEDADLECFESAPDYLHFPYLFGRHDEVKAKCRKLLLSITDEADAFSVFCNCDRDKETWSCTFENIEAAVAPLELMDKLREARRLIVAKLLNLFWALFTKSKTCTCKTASKEMMTLCHYNLVGALWCEKESSKVDLVKEPDEYHGSIKHLAEALRAVGENWPVDSFIHYICMRSVTKGLTTGVDLILRDIPDLLTDVHIERMCKQRLKIR